MQENALSLANTLKKTIEKFIGDNTNENTQEL